MFDYLKFDTESYLSDYRKNKTILHNLKEQLNELSELRGMDFGDKVQTSPRQDGLEKFALQRIRLESEISAYENYLKTYDRAFESLAEQDRLIINVFFREPVSNPVQYLENRLAYSRANIYILRTNAINHFQRLIVG